MKFVSHCVLILCGIVLSLSGLAVADNRALDADPNTGLAFGAFDITASDLAVTHVTLVRVKPTKMYMGSSGEKATVTYTNGEFFSPNLSPGMYSVVGFFSGDKFFALEKGLRANTFQVEPGRVAYAGSYKLTLTKGGVFRQDKGTFERIDAPDAEAQLLRWLAKELAPTGWASSVNARLVETSK